MLREMRLRNLPLVDLSHLTERNRPIRVSLRWQYRRTTV